MERPSTSKSAILVVGRVAWESPKARCSISNISWYRRGLMEWNSDAIFPCRATARLPLFLKLHPGGSFLQPMAMNHDSVGASSSLARRALHSASFRMLRVSMTARYTRRAGSLIRIERRSEASVTSG